MNVFGAIVSALLVAWLHNRFYTIKLPDAINFFGGRRFVPIITVLVLPISGIAMSYLWPYVSDIILSLGRGIQSAGSFGSFLFGFSERMLIPTGLHHILNQTVRFTPIGGTAIIDGHQIIGALSIFNEALANPGLVSDHIVREATRFLAQGKIPVMVFGLPAAALAIFHTAKTSEKATGKSIGSGQCRCFHCHRYNRAFRVCLYVRFTCALSGACDINGRVLYVDGYPARNDWQRSRWPD